MLPLCRRGLFLQFEHCGTSIFLHRSPHLEPSGDNWLSIIDSQGLLLVQAGYRWLSKKYSSAGVGYQFFSALMFAMTCLRNVLWREILVISRSIPRILSVSTIG